MTEKQSAPIVRVVTYDAVESAIERSKHSGAWEVPVNGSQKGAQSPNVQPTGSTADSKQLRPKPLK